MYSNCLMMEKRLIITLIGGRRICRDYCDVCDEGVTDSVRIFKIDGEFLRVSESLIKNVSYE